jgi:hypothetical protein
VRIAAWRLIARETRLAIRSKGIAIEQETSQPLDWRFNGK